MSQLHDSADKVIDVLEKMNSIVNDVANIPVPRGLTKKHKQFFVDFYEKELHYRLDDLFETIKNFEIEEKGYPFDSREFKDTWLKYKRNFYHQEGKFLSAEREEIQLDYLQQFYKNDKEAVDALKYIINKGHTFIYKVNYKKKESEPNVIVESDDFD